MRGLRVAAFLQSAAFLLAAGAGAEELSFNKHIRPILSDNCFVCHGPDGGSRQAGLRLDLEEEATAPRSGGAAITPGAPDKSLILERILAEDPVDRMPPPETNKNVSQEEAELLRQWIAEGAEYEPHWAFLPPQRAETPDAAAEWARNPIDRFVMRKLEAEGLKPAPEADKRTLIRRLSQDLTGLPPSWEEVESFVADDSVDAYENLVDRLLAMPHYGERMATYWLDLVRYADTVGYHGDQYMEVWPYRDYVINAFNANKSFDQFTIEQLAGDMLPDATREQQIASGYNRLNQITAEGGAQAKEYLSIYMADRIRTTGSVWMGVTMGCAQCHDHKFDPITAKDFYSFGAFFAGLEEVGVYLDGDEWLPRMRLLSPEQETRLAELEQEIAAAQASLDTATPELASAQKDWEAAIREEIVGKDLDWRPHKPTRVSTKEGTTLVVQDDYSVLASGTDPATDVYTVELPTDQERVTGLRLEALGHDSFPRGLSRANGNFVLTEVKITAHKEGQEPRPIAIKAGKADYAQEGFPIEHAFDGNAATGWASEGHKKDGPRQAVFIFDQPLEAGPGTVLEVVLAHEHVATQHTIGRFRLALTSVDEPELGAQQRLPEDVFQALLQEGDAPRSEEAAARVAAYYRSIAPSLAPQRDLLAQLKQEKEQIETSAPTTLVSREVEEPRTVRVLPRGNWMDDSGEVVEPGVPGFLPQIEKDGRATRLDLAKWMVSEENPLTARVFVNRLWAMFYGTGISKVLDDVGSQGEWPTHPELLDWLATEFMESGWDVKHMVRLIVTSTTYRQSSQDNPEAREVDPYNRLVARQAPFRLPAEFIRDHALAASGLLCENVGGPSVYPYQPEGYWDDTNTFRGPLIYEASEGEDQYRRGLYTHWKRTFLHPSMQAFDAPTREECTAERVESNTPLQALVLLNDPSYVEAARVLAEKVLREGGANTAERLDYAFRRVLSRPPNAKEAPVLAELLGRHQAQYEADPEAAQELISTGQYPVPEDFPAHELAAWTSVARVLLNLHETITRS